MQEPLISERIRLALADDIASGVIPEGAALDEQQIAVRFEASRTPVREALRMLAVEGLVDMRPRRGAVVATLSIERIVEMFEFAAEIEAMCVRLATYRMNPMERARLMQIHIKSQMSAQQSDADQYADYNLEFHEAIYRGTHNQLISEQALTLRTRMAAFRRAQLFEDGRPAVSHDEHNLILDAMTKGDGEGAAQLMRSHMFKAANVIIERLVKVPAKGASRG